MANPRRPTFQTHHQQPPSILPISQSETEIHQPLFVSLLTSISLFLKKPHAFPFLLSTFILLTWLSLRFQHSNNNNPSLPQSKYKPIDREHDLDANMVRFSGVDAPSEIVKDGRGWLLNPVEVALRNGIHGGAQFCASLHVGEIRPGAMRGNHRHHTCNETFIIWGAETKFRLENPNLKSKGFAEVTISSHEVAVAASPAGTAHALINGDSTRTTFFLGCQDSVIDYNRSSTDYKVWKDLLIKFAAT